MDTLKETLDQGANPPIEDQVMNLLEMAVSQDVVPPSDEQLLRRTPCEKTEPPAQHALPSTDNQPLNQTLPRLAPSPPSSRRKSVKKLVRPALGVGLLGLAVWSLAPLLFDVRSTHAVVNAPVVIVRSPIDGMVRFLCQTASGTNAVANTPLLEVKNSLADNDRLDALKDEQALLEARIEGLRQQLGNLSNLRDDLLTTTHKYEEARLRTLEFEREGAKSLVESAEAVEKQRDSEEEMLDELRKNRNVSVQDANASTSPPRRPAIPWFRRRKAWRTWRSRFGHCKDGVHVGPNDGRNDLPYSAQRLHEISFRMEEIRAAFGQDEAKLAQLVAAHPARKKNASTCDRSSRQSRRPIGSSGGGTS